MITNERKVEIETGWSKWAASLSARMQEALRDFQPAECYRSTENRGHYRLYTIEEPRDSSAPLTAKIIHGRDSYLPGVAAFGVALSTLIPCNCGNWKAPTAAQVETTSREIQEMKRQRGH